ncbi:MAG: hypothetical protein Q7T41_01855 [Candidatus Saccharibacteria bacterium]|nr:hypothetical protein [Candidatus Saccharibacteria bacterium]
MFKRVGLPLALALMASCAAGGPETAETSIMPADTVVIDNESFEQKIIDGVETFRVLYGCLEPITVEIKEIDIDSPINNGQENLTGGTAERGLVIINPIVEEIDKKIPGAAWHTAFHEASHACNIGEILFDSPYELPESGIKMTGSEGLSAVGISYSTNERLTFSLIEEGVADLIAYNETHVDGMTEVYKAVRETTSRLLAEKNISLQEVQDFQENSDLIGFIARLVGKNPEEVTTTDITEIFNIYFKDSGINNG